MKSSKLKLASIILAVVLCLLVLSAPAGAVVQPNSDFYVLDNENVLSAETEKYIIDRNLNLVSNCKGAQVCVVVTDSTNGQDIEEYATELFNAWGIGSKTEDNKAEGKTYKVGIVQFVDDASLNQIEAAIEAELDAKATELGVKFDYTLYNGQADGTTLNQIGAELVGKWVDLIVPIATPAVKIMQSATEDTEIPIVFSAVSDPVGAGIVDSLDAPGGRITGTSDALNTKGLLDLMLAQNPDTKTVGLLYSKSEDSSKQPIEDAKAYLEGKGIRCVEKTGTTTDEVTSAVDALIAEKVDAVFTPTDNTIMTAELAIYEKFLNAKIPQYCGADSFALNGAFVGYGVDYTKLGTITADMVVQVLVDGKDPATLPVTTFDNGIAMINSESCAALGYDLAAVKQAFDGKCSSVLETTTQQNFD